MTSAGAPDVESGAKPNLKRGQSMTGKAAAFGCAERRCVCLYFCHRSVQHSS